MNFDNRSINLKAKTWLRDSYELFDYETPNTVSQDFVINSSGAILRQNNKISFTQYGTSNKNLQIDNNTENLAIIQAKNGKKFIITQLY